MYKLRGHWVDMARHQSGEQGVEWMVKEQTERIVGEELRARFPLYSRRVALLGGKNNRSYCKWF